MKNKKAPKDQIDVEVKKLLNLKAEYKALTGEDWKPSIAAVTTSLTKTESKSAQNGTTGKNKIIKTIVVFYCF